MVVARWSKRLVLALYILLAVTRHHRRAAEEKRCARRAGLDRAGLAGADFRLPALLPVRHQPGDAARPEAGPAGRKQATPTRLDASRTRRPNIALLSRCQRDASPASPLTAGNALDRPGRRRRRPIPPCWRPSAAPSIRIALSSYIFRNDEAGQRIRRRADRSRPSAACKVRVLLDSVGAGYFYPRILYRMQRGRRDRRRASCTPGCPGACHSSTCAITASCWWWTAASAFIGGINIGAENCDSSSAQAPIKDVHFRVDGPGGADRDGRLRPRLGFHHRRRPGRGLLVAETGGRGPVFARGLRSGPDADIYKLELHAGRGDHPGAKAHPHRHALFPARCAAAIRHRPGGAARRRSGNRAAAPAATSG